MPKNESTPKSPINWILSGVEGCKHLIIRTLRLRSVSGFPFNCLFGADSIFIFYKSVTWNVHIIIHGLHERCAYGQFMECIKSIFVSIS